MNIEHISVSRHQLFMECNEKYKFKYHLKTPSEEPEPVHFVYGKIVHKIAETYVARADPQRFAEVVSDVLSGNVEIEPGKKAPRLGADYTRKMPGHLKNLRDFISRVGFKTDGHLEYHFKYDLMPPNGYNATGFIDRIAIMPNGRYFIIDYKTTKKGPWRKNSRTIVDDLQLRLYARVVQRDFGVDAKDIYCCLFYMDGGSGEVVPANYSQAMLDDAEAELLRAYVEIHQMDPDEVRGRLGDHCRFCDFRKKCKWRSLT